MRSRTANTNTPRANPGHGPGVGAASGAVTALRGRQVSFCLAAIFTLALAVIPAVAWPGDVQWVMDEPMLIANAARANQQHRLASEGLVGTVGARYGPMPTQIYQLFLLFSHDLPVLVALRAGVSAAVFAGSLLWLAWTLGLTPWFCAAVVLAPRLWFYQRTLWDCSFLIPICTVGVAGYAAFLRGRSRGASGSGGSLVVALTAFAVAPLIHLQALPLSVAFIGHAGWRYRSEIWRHRIGLLAAGLVVLLLNGGYLLSLSEKLVLEPARQLGAYRHGRAPASQAITGPVVVAALFAEQSDSLFTHFAIPGTLYRVAARVTEIIVPLIWLGIALCVARECMRWRRSGRGPAGQAPAHAGGGDSVRAVIAGISLICLVLQLLFVVAIGAAPQMNYCFGMLPIDVLFAWFAIDVLQRIRLGTAIAAVWGLSAACVTLTIAYQVHTQGLLRIAKLPSLADQMQIASELSQYGNPHVWTDVPCFHAYPQELSTLLMLAAHRPASVSNPQPLLIQPEEDQATGRLSLELAVLPSGAPVPRGAWKVNLTPHPDSY